MIYVGTIIFFKSGNEYVGYTYICYVYTLILNECKTPVINNQNCLYRVFDNVNMLDESNTRPSWKMLDTVLNNMK